MKSVIIIVLAFVFLFVPIGAYADNSVSNDPSTLDWSIIFVSSFTCNDRNQEALYFYEKLTKYYLDKFNFNNSVIYSDCVKESQMHTIVDRQTKVSDLTIVIIDYLGSFVDRHTTGSLGHFSSWEFNTIVSQAETVRVENKGTAWALSHELAHFALHWEKYDNEIVGNAVHQIQEAYDNCKTRDTTMTACSSLWNVFITPSNQEFLVMSPDFVIKMAESMVKPKESTPVNKTPKQLCEERTDSDGYHVWKDGKCVIIFNKTSKQLCEERTDSDGYYLWKDGKCVIIFNKTSKQLCEERTDSDGYHVWKNGKCVIIFNKTTEQIPDIQVTIATNHSINDIARDQGSEGEELCVLFSLYESNSWNGNSNTSLKFKEIKVTKKILSSMFSGEIIAGPFSTLYTTDGSGHVNFCEQLKMYDDNSFNVYKYTGTFSGGYGYESSVGPDITIEIKSSNLEQERKNLQQTIDKQKRDKERLEVHNQNVVILENAKKEREQIQKEKQENQLKKEAQTLQSKSYYQLNKFKKGNDDAEKSLKSIVTSTLEQKQEIDKAWDLLKINKNKLSEIETKYHTGDIRISIEQYEDAKKWYYFYDKNNVEMEIGDNLKEISKLIEESQPKTCFLMWCW